MNEKKYKRGSKNSNLKKPVLFKVYENQIQFMSLFVQYKHEQGYDKLAYTRTDIISEALQDFISKNQNEFLKEASDDLQLEAKKLLIFKTKHNE
ncbi:hypothetical protein [Chryseobacterium muglaense]|uniref:CopG family transcriptional regulator n=1 Tax=Chryseobacterium muglaense TaxID=2893752 RepID=A0ABR8MA07_9FLAO|nr:hypothetical protein [Chryseobacterium muglaense]MBD3906746.1 hypothetical protein [Chryseobacterium muglaense]